MKKSRIFMAAGTLILAITAIFATKANKKFFTTVQTAFAGASTSQYIAKETTANIMTTKNNSNLALYLYINGTKEGVLLTTSTNNSGKAVLYR